MFGAEDKYQRRLTSEIEYLIAHITKDFQSIVYDLGSVDMVAAKEIYRIIESDAGRFQALNEYREEFRKRRSLARLQTAQKIYYLPAPNSIDCQWWFSLDSIEKIAMRIKRLAGNGEVAFFGAPTVAYFYDSCFPGKAHLFEKDEKIIEALDDESNNSSFHPINLLTTEPSTLVHQKFAAILMDPPWYEKQMTAFVKQASALLREDGCIFASIPSQLTRPNAQETRMNFVSILAKANIQLRSIDCDFFDYEIPAFENLVLNKIDAEFNRPWRKSDLLIAQADGMPIVLPFVKEDDYEILSFSKGVQANQFRVFLKKDAFCAAQEPRFQRIEEFSNDVSTRKNKNKSVHLWTSNLVGYSIKDYNLAHSILELWQEGCSLAETAEQLEGTYPGLQLELQSINKEAFFWNEDGSVKRLSPEEMAETTHYSAIAIKDFERRLEQESDGFRLGYQRDSDRIIWSESFRNLANKTQVFSFEHDEVSATRTRLTHSVEVMQLATTIGSSFALNKDLIEAGAKCHDIGHAPFGHAGEYALNMILGSIHPELGGFNHYEHGLDVVEYLESPYSSPHLGGLFGLNLMPATLECIVKHTFWKSQGEMSQDSILSRTKHGSLFKNTYGSLESQTVRIADKISYLVSDLEDGIKLGIIQYEDLMGCRLFYKAPLDFNKTLVSSSDDSFLRLFRSQRRELIKIIMEDLLTSSEKNLAPVNNKEDIENASDYLIRFSPDMDICITEVWHRLQSGILHKNSIVMAANYRASQIISSLFYLFSFSPELIDGDFRIRHSGLQNSEYLDYYQKKVGQKVSIAQSRVKQFNFKLLIGQDTEIGDDNYWLPTYNIICAKDFVASLTDQKALREYHAHFDLLTS